MSGSFFGMAGAESSKPRHGRSEARWGFEDSAPATPKLSEGGQLCES